MGRTSDSSLADIVKACVNGDKKAWARLLDLVSPVVFSICGRMHLSREESFDIYGQVCYLLLKNICSIRSANKLLAYVATTTRREIYAYCRRSRVFDYVEAEGLTDMPAGLEMSPDRILETTERSEILMNAMVMLPERDYWLLRTLFFDQSEPNYHKAARLLDVPVSSVGPIRARSLARLRNILKKKRFKF